MLQNHPGGREFVGIWKIDNHSCDRSRCLFAYRTCLKCEEGRSTILRVFRENHLDEMGRVYGSLQQAVQDAFNDGLLTKDDQLVKDWLYLETDIEGLSPEELKEYERRKVLAQMRIHSCPFL